MKIDHPKRSVAKALSWRLISVSITFSVSLFITHNTKLALSISLLDMVIKLGSYYYHERFWAYVRWGRLKKKKLKKKEKTR